MEAEHRVQLGLLRAFQDALRRPNGREAAGVLLRQIVDYSEAHFASEHSLMREHGYPGYEAHAEEHERLLQELRQLTLDWHQRECADLDERATRISERLLGHIASADHRLEDYLVGLRSGSL